MGKNQHVAKHPNGWKVKGAGKSRAKAVTNKQVAANEIAKQIATNQKSEVLIHGRNGQIREKNSHGNDPKNVKG